MNPTVANTVADGLLKGVFDVLDATLTLEFSYAIREPALVSDAVLAQLLERYPVILHGRLQSGLGAAAILFGVRDAARIAALVRETEAQEALDDEDRATLKEVADPAIGGGMTNLMERFGRAVEQLDEVDVLDTGTEAAGPLLELLGDEPSSVTFSFQAAPDFSGEGAVLFSRSIEDLAPGEAPVAPSPPPAEEGAVPGEAALSDEEMSDILGGFGPEGAAEPEAPARRGTENLDMVLDIRLLATARLGRMEMPLADILELGPGSIIEVGHLVDEPVELLINDKLIARGDVVVVDEKFGLRITEIVSPRERIESLH